MYLKEHARRSSLRAYGQAMVAAFTFGLLVSCVTRNPAPVVDRQVTSREAPPVAASAPVPAAKTIDARPEFHEVQKGETLFSIAFQHGVDYREMAQWNGLDDPNVLKVGQRLRLTPPDGASVVATVAPDGVVVTPLGSPELPAKSAAPVAPAATLKTEPKAIKQPYSDKTLAQLQTPGAEKPKSDAKLQTKPGEPQPAPVEDGIDWAWPSKGRPKVLFTETSKGIDIPGKRGQPVIAAAAGKVIHVGSNLRGYGKLIIIQHSSMFLSAYAHNSQVLVREGERIAKGQKIAEMGDTDTDQVKLHFEIRRFGKPVDPLRYLPAEKAS